MPEPLIQFRPDPARRAAYQQAADAAGVTISEWMRRAADAALPSAVRKKLPAMRRPGRPSQSDENAS